MPTAVSLLRLPGLTDTQRTYTVDLIARNVSNLVDMTYKLERLARDRWRAPTTPACRRSSISSVAAEAARQLREMADARGVQLRIADDMPSMIVDVGRLELALVNLLSNAIKYCDPAKEPRYRRDHRRRRDRRHVRNHASGTTASAFPPSALPTSSADSRARMPIATASTHITGVGLGLAIVDDCVRAMNGAISVESQEGVGTAFVPAMLPCEPAVEAPRNRLRRARAR